MTHADLRRMEADAQILGARCVGLTQQMRVMITEVRDMARAVIDLTGTVLELRAEIAKAKTDD